MTDEPKNMIALVTGATSGIGKATALELAKRGLTVVVMSRDETEGESTIAEIKQVSGNSHIDLLVCDLSAQDSVRAAVAEFKHRYDRLHILINCAGVFVNKRVVTKDNLELMFATNHLGHFLLTNLLLDRLETGRPSRVVNVTAPSAMKPDFDDLQSERKFSAITAFGKSKADNLLFTFALARRLDGKNVTVNAYFPGVTRGTGLVKQAPIFTRVIMSLASPFLRTPERSAQGLVELATSNEFSEVNGQFIHDGKKIVSPLQKEIKVQEQLWTESEKLTKIK